MRMRVMVIVGIMTIGMVMRVMMELEGRHHVTGFAVCSNGKQQSKLLMSTNSEHARKCLKKKIMMTNKTLLAS